MCIRDRPYVDFLARLFLFILSARRAYAPSKNRVRLDVRGHSSSVACNPYGLFSTYVAFGMVEVAGVHFLHPVLARLLIPGMAHLLNCLFGARQGVRREDPPVRPGPVSTFRARTHTKPFDDRHGRSASHRAARARIVIAQIRRPFFPAWEPAHRAHDRRCLLYTSPSPRDS